MQKTGFRRILVFALIGAMLLSTVLLNLQRCKSDPVKPLVTPSTPAKTPIEQIVVPAFNPDSAFFFIKKQVDFGPRVPNTEGHKKCAAWLAGQFRRFGLTVVEQKFQAHHKGTTFDCINIIGQYKPENPRRVLYAAHWDSRAVADQDTKDTNKPILGPMTAAVVWAFCWKWRASCNKTR